MFNPSSSRLFADVDFVDSTAAAKPSPTTAAAPSTPITGNSRFGDDKRPSTPSNSKSNDALKKDETDRPGTPSGEDGEISGFSAKLARKLNGSKSGSGGGKNQKK